VTVVVQNAHALTYFGTRAVRACGVAALDSGAISLTLLRRARPADVAAVLGRLLSGRPNVGRHRQVDRFAAVGEATVVSADGAPLPLEADGEFLGEYHAIRFGVAPGALRVLA
jgi:diacylglycerol kinase family enzyme